MDICILYNDNKINIIFIKNIENQSRTKYIYMQFYYI